MSDSSSSDETPSKNYICASENNIGAWLAPRSIDDSFESSTGDNKLPVFGSERVELSMVFTGA